MRIGNTVLGETSQLRIRHVDVNCSGLSLAKLAKDISPLDPALASGPPSPAAGGLFNFGRLYEARSKREGRVNVRYRGVRLVGHQAVKMSSTFPYDFELGVFFATGVCAKF